MSAVIEQRERAWKSALEYLQDGGERVPTIRRRVMAIVEEGVPDWTTRPTAVFERGTGETIGATEARAYLVLAREVAAGNAEVVGRLG